MEHHIGDSSAPSRVPDESKGIAPEQVNEGGYLVPEKTAIERAFELARQGTFKNLQEVRHRLAREGYSEVTQHLSGCRHVAALGNFAR